MRRELNILIGLVLLSIASPVFSQQGGSYEHFHGHMWGSGGWFLGPVFMLLSLAAIIAIVLFIFKQTGMFTQSSPTTSAQHKETPLEALEMRYAKGEIDHEEYELRRKTLDS